MTSFRVPKIHIPISERDLKIKLLCEDIQPHINKSLSKYLIHIKDKINNYQISSESIIYFKNTEKMRDFSDYFTNFYKFCFDKPSNIMIEEAINFKIDYGST